MRRPTSQRLLLALGVACWLAGPGASASRGEEIIRLPPYLVEGKLPGRPWRYARMPGFEVLSRCYDTKSRALAFAYYQAQQQLTALIPARFLGRFDVPTKLILYDDSLWPATLEESAAAILRSSPLIPETPKGPPPGAPTPFDRIRADDPILQPPPIYRPPIKVVEGPTTYSQAPVFFDDMRLTDDDAIVLFTVAPADNTNYYRRYLRPTYLAQLLAARTPTLPSWFVAGFLDLYERLDFAEDTITLGAFVWSNREETETAKKDPAPIVGQWLPLVELLSEDAEVLARRQGAASRIATEQLRLFVRWALDPEGGARRE
ncbi:MAG TPA: hypothetical protein VHE13_02395, partial [Opitutus sp.]|nr:hypothetical protein [Opitutus sp.]